MKYRNLVFDVGGVLLDYRWKDMLRVDRGMSEERGIEFGTRIFLDPLWKQLDLEDAEGAVYRSAQGTDPKDHGSVRENLTEKCRAKGAGYGTGYD